MVDIACILKSNMMKGKHMQSNCLGKDYTNADHKIKRCRSEKFIIINKFVGLSCDITLVGVPRIYGV